VATLTALRPIIHIRIATFNPTRIGEFICRIDMAIALVGLRDSARTTRRRNFFIIPRSMANEQVRIMYLRSLSNMPAIEPLDCRTSLLGRLLIDPARRLAGEFTATGRHASLYCGEGAATMETCGLRPSGRPLIHFTPAELEQGWESLKRLGIDPSTKYVCLHVRDAAYLRQAQPERDWSYHDYRNPPVESYVPMVEQVLRRGYTVVRMGKVVEGPFPLRHDRLVDYSDSGAQTDFLDVFLYAHATLAVAGSVSGIDQLGHAFNIPSVATDFIPFDDPRWAADCALIIPAMVREKTTGELLPLSKLLGSRYGSARHYEEAGLKVVPNSPEEITQAVLEGLQRVEGSWTDTAEDTAHQEAFWAWAEECGISATVPSGPWDKDHYRARIGRHFLETHSHLLMK
jgi:putative glycosyltransferase (TIGR04372 family)